MDRYAVIGHPIAHSRSPAIHRQFAAQTGQRMQYEAILAPKDGFRACIAERVKEGFRGMNITVPFKEEAFALAQEHTPRATLAQAANTFVVQADRSLLADNTDGAGLVRDLSSNLGVTLHARKILILGAGGAVRGVLAPLLAHNPAHLHIANRTLSRAEHLLSQFAHLGRLSASGYDDLVGHHFDLIINATSAGLDGQQPALPDGLLNPGGGCYDMFYGQTLTPFLHWAQQQNPRWYADGLGMLVEQAAEAFYLWRGIRPDTAPLLHQRLRSP